VITVAAENSAIRPRCVWTAPHIQPAAAIDGPMMLRMSTLNRSRAFPQLRIQLCARNKNASPNTSNPRIATARVAARTSPVRRSFDAADRGTATPARNRKSGAPKPPTIMA